MKKLGIIIAIAGVIAVGAAAAYMGGFIGGENIEEGGDSGVDISATPCDGIAAARQAVSDEYKERVEKAESSYSENMEAASDTYWENYRNYETAKYACETEALLADPCKDLFERSSALAQEILNNIDSGFDETKAQERDQVKQEWEDCKANPPKEDTYEGKKAKCKADFDSAVALAQNLREQTEANAATTLNDALETTESAHTSKHATLDAIEEACSIPPPTTGVQTGGITTGGTGTVIESGNPACTGRFTGYDEDIQREISRLQSLYQQAQAGGKVKGLGGTEALGAKITDLRAEMSTGPRNCSADADCGDATPVCCSGTEIGRVICDGGECASEKEECEGDEICTGKPAKCVSPTIGLESEAVNISKSYTLGTPCNNKIQVLNLAQANENSDRFEITGNMPDWLGLSHVGGKLPQDVEIIATCSQFRTPGTFTASVRITVYDKDNNLINTIPVNITITVTGTPVVEEDVNIKVGEDLEIEDSDDNDVVVESEEPIGIRSTNMSFAHVKPGEYSEVYLTVMTEPGVAVEAKLSGPGVVSNAQMNKTADSGGQVSFTWRINAYGSYSVSGSAGGTTFSKQVVVN